MKKKILISLLSAAGILLAGYLGIAVFFMGHFLPGTKAGEKDLSFQSSEKLSEILAEEVEGYQLSVKSRPGEGGTEIMKGQEISLKLSAGAGREITRKQNAFLWPAAFLSGETERIHPVLSWDKEALKERINALEVVREGKEGPVSAKISFDGQKFVIAPEKYGVKKEQLEKKIKEKIETLSETIDIQKEKCLESPKYRMDSPETVKACEEMNRYISASVTYSMDQSVTVDAQTIAPWVSCGENMAPVLDEAAVREWMRGFGETYDTLGKTRTIITLDGKTAEVSGGTYGWSIDEEAETAELIRCIRSGETVVKEPACIQRAAAWGGQDWGQTYLEVDLTRQHMWYIKDGVTVLETDVVTGIPIPERETPVGVYSILYTQEDAVLVGEDDPVTGEPIYRTHVDYWMPFTQQGHGFHDADWQAAFGGSIYTTDRGSHGCVNMPVDRAGELYGMLEAGTPVVIHK